MVMVGKLKDLSPTLISHLSLRSLKQEEQIRSDGHTHYTREVKDLADRRWISAEGLRGQPAVFFPVFPAMTVGDID